MKRKLKKLILDTKFSLQFSRRWNNENPELANEMKLHYLDGRIEALEEILGLLNKGVQNDPGKP